MAHPPPVDLSVADIRSQIASNGQNAMVTLDTIKNFDRENLGTAVGILLLGLCHCALEVEISRSQKFFYYSVAGKRRKKLLPGQGVYNMPIFILSALCSQNSVYVEWSYFAPKCFNFYLHPSRFDKFSL